MLLLKENYSVLNLVNLVWIIKLYLFAKGNREKKMDKFDTHYYYKDYSVSFACCTAVYLY